jgi:hypothetical protein
MMPEALRDMLRKQPFKPFRLVMSDGAGFEVRHPDLLWVGQWSAHVGLTGDPGKTFFERSVEVELNHVIRIEPLQPATKGKSNGKKRRLTQLM